MHRLESMKEALINCAQSNMGNLANVNAEELGEVIDMVKDLEEAIYYHTIVDSMNEKSDPSTSNMYYTPGYEYNRMYTPAPSPSNYGGTRGYREVRQSPREVRTYNEYEYPMMSHDYREGRSGTSRKMYMESKEQHKDTQTKIRELENYMNELTMDISEMMQDTTPEEKQMLQKKLNTLLSKVNV